LPHIHASLGEVNVLLYAQRRHHWQAVCLVRENYPLVSQTIFSRDTPLQRQSKMVHVVLDKHIEFHYPKGSASTASYDLPGVCSVNADMVIPISKSNAILSQSSSSQNQTYRRSPASRDSAGPRRSRRPRKAPTPPFFPDSDAAMWYLGRNPILITMS
jgi:hypothetical protein